jgi:hypothetical protein
MICVSDIFFYSSCHSGELRASKILLNMNIDIKVASNAVRLSVGRETTKSQIDLVIRDLKNALRRIISANYPITGAANHGVSHAIYLDDPDGNGVELYWDLPKEEWPFDENGSLQMITDRLDLEELLSLSNC